MARWQFYDIVGSSSYEFEVNPFQGGSPTYEKNFDELRTLAGRVIRFEGQDNPAQFEWSGRILSQNQHELFVTWFLKRHQIRLTDDLGREFMIYISSYVPQRLRGPRHAQWKFEYKMSAVELDWPATNSSSAEAASVSVWVGQPHVVTS